MPRRKQANSSNSNGTSFKRAKTISIPVDMLPEIDGFTVRWDYEDSGKWLPHSDSISEQLTDRYNGGDTEVEVTDNSGRKLLISLDHLIQKTANKPVRQGRIRCCFQDEKDKEYYSWQWQAKNGTWQTYCIPSSLALEKAFRKSVPTVDIVTSNQSFLIDLQTLKQSNEVDNVISSVQRIKSGASSSTSDDTVDNSCNSSTSSSASSRNGRKTNATQSQATTNRKKSGKPCTQSADKVKKECPEENGHSNEDKKKIKTVVVRGMASVDDECPLLGRVHVYTQGNDVWDCMLNQTNALNNNNKFYLIQLLQQDNSRHYYVWLRWGRVGYKGQTNLIDCALDLNNAIDVFTKKFHDKTKNDWSERHKFKQVSGKYDLIQMDYSTQGKDDVDGNNTKKESVCKVPDSKLDPSLQKLIKLISDIDSMKETVIEMKYDAQKAPLGRLTVKQIQAGYQALKKIAACIEKKNFGASLSSACDEFYTRIPHTFGMRKPPVIRDEQTVKEKIQLLEALGDIEIAINILKQGDMSENPIDKTYKSLECELTLVSSDHPDFKLVSNYLQNTHAVTHNSYRMQLMEVYSCTKMAEHNQFVDYGNRMLLWHGSRLTNWVGILSRGLRIAPPEAPVTGDMFGKGIYFADMSSKSANYCFATKKRNIGLALLCEVSLGEIHELLEANYYADRLPPGKNSVKGLGRVAPHPSSYQTLKDGMIIPNGAGSDTGVVNPAGYTLNYNEYVVYDTRQVKMKYLVKIQFDFK
ncbi:poly [ADP-ribose] polymerase 2 isoform X1 [Octopus bimaculoides]|uniref:Poly [ADP-ribose] polymerase n=2 Tax=Octopus bimaculoides TaxID=37653 RepID=A0A0L8IDY2_OCTBM|nr:poly [ADP-ribose] polymerase 2 isoform X1 [Octopus bimaculoides]|eukprot:XP_014776883.1 PREDICTED: poly [ADP-ribose] polymerase 2-like [Octopus bimaculoides]